MYSNVRDVFQGYGISSRNLFCFVIKNVRVIFWGDTSTLIQGMEPKKGFEII